MTSPQPVANHRPPQLPVKPEPRPRTALRLNLEGGQLKKRIDLFEGLQNGKDESPVEDTNSGLRCRQPRVISPEQKRWTQLDVTSEEPKKQKDISVSRQRHGQHTMHPGHKRSPMSPVAPKPIIPPRRKVEIKEPVSEPLVNGKPVVDKKRDRPLTGDARAQRDENVRNSVLALVSAFEHGKTSVAIEQKSKMLTVPEGGRSRTNSESSTSTNGTMSLTRNGADCLMPPTLQKNRMSRSMDSLVQEFETVAFDLSRESSRHRSTGSSSPESSPWSNFRHRSAGDSSPDPLPRSDFRLRIPCGSSPSTASWKNSRHRRAGDSSSEHQTGSNTRHSNAIDVPVYSRQRVINNSSPEPLSDFRHRSEHDPFPVFESQTGIGTMDSLTIPVVQINAGNRTMDHSQLDTTSQSDVRLCNTDDTSHDFTIREHPSYTNVDISPSDPIPHKPVRTFQQDIYNQSKVNVTSRDMESQKTGITRTNQNQALEVDGSEKSKALRLKQSLSNAAALKVERSPMAAPRTKSARRADGSPEYYKINPDDYSRNCNHNGGMEDNIEQNSYPRFEEASNVFPKPLKNGFDPLVIDNNNQSSFLTKLKSPVSRRPRLSSPSVPPSSLPVPQSKAPQPSSLPQAPPRNQSPSKSQPQKPLQPPRPNQPPKVKMISPEIVAKERARLLSPPTSPPNNSGCTSPETLRRLTDSALVPSLSPPSHRRNFFDASPIVGEYAEPVNVIKRSLSDESLATLRRPSPVVDMEGYSVPGSHLWEAPKFHTMKPKV